MRTEESADQECSVSTPSSKKGANKKSDGKVQSKLCFKYSNPGWERFVLAMGKGQTKGRKGHKGKARPAGNKGRAHTEEAWRHAQQVNARRKAEGKHARSTASISRSQRRAQQHHFAKTKAKPEAESSRAKISVFTGLVAAAQLQRLPKSPSYSEESEEKKSTGPGGAGARDDFLVDSLQPAAAAKATGKILPEQKYKRQRQPADRCRARAESMASSNRHKMLEAADSWTYHR